jgi:hypothetical protein
MTGDLFVKVSGRRGAACGRVRNLACRPRVVLGYYPLGKRGRRERLSIAQCGSERPNWSWFLISTKQAPH